MPENQVGPTLAYFRIAAIVALLLAASADLVGRRRLLLVTIFGQAIFTLLTAFAPTIWHFVGGAASHPRLRLCRGDAVFVVIAEEIAAKARGWANGTSSLSISWARALRRGLFGAVNILPYGWRALYVIGAVPIFLVGLLRRRLPETKRFRDPGRSGLENGRRRWTCCEDMARQYPGARCRP